MKEHHFHFVKRVQRTAGYFIEGRAMPCLRNFRAHDVERAADHVRRHRRGYLRGVSRCFGYLQQSVDSGYFSQFVSVHFTVRIYLYLSIAQTCVLFHLDPCLRIVDKISDDSGLQFIIGERIQKNPDFILRNRDEKAAGSLGIAQNDSQFLR